IASGSSGATLSGSVVLTPGLHTVRLKAAAGSFDVTGVRVDPAQASPPAGTATFVRADGATQGSWQGAYGADGYNVVGASASYPASPPGTPGGRGPCTWAASTSDVRALQQPGSSTDRIAATWYAANSFTVDVNFTDGQQHQLAAYLLDWDRQGRSERVDVL